MSVYQFKRRDFLRFAGAASALSLAGCAATEGTRARVVVIGGGFGGATAAKYIRLWDPSIEVVMVERLRQFTSCPTSNLVIGGSRQISELQRSYNALKSRWGVKVVEDEALSVDTAKRVVKLQRGGDLNYDRLVVSPGIDFMFERIAGYEAALRDGAVQHAWKAGPQTIALRSKLELMPNGGVFVLGIPLMPFRCPPGPYERVCQVASYLKQAKPRSKILVLDANQKIVSKGKLFQEAWDSLYKGLIEYRPQNAVESIDARTRTVKTEFGSVRGDVLNIVPEQKAGAIAAKAGLVNVNNRWCEVNWMTCESKATRNVHIVGDATQGAPMMPKSGHMANSQAKVCAAAVIARINGDAPNPTPIMNNTCYSFVSANEVVHVASVHQWDKDENTIVPVKAAGGLSPARNRVEADYAWSWAQNIWADMLG
ncbi:MAG: NAD(P)/FAD-dependent oxidoreductase [bacterium]|jgi:sulfide dehydrogenase [flavocytochrome c] flavoprotein subunit